MNKEDDVHNTDLIIIPIGILHTYLTFVTFVGLNLNKLECWYTV